MPIVRISQPRPGTLRLRAALRMLPGPRAAVWPMVLAWVAICGLLAFLPGWWLSDWRELALTRWFQDAHHSAGRLTQEWEHWTLPVPSFKTGEEPEVAAWLKREALVTSLVDPYEGKVWLRDGERLRPALPGEGQVPADWARRAMGVADVWQMAAGRSGVPRAFRTDGGFDAGLWWLVGSVDPHWRARASIVSFFGKWCLIKTLEPGSPAVEAWLQGTLGAGASYRFGVLDGYAIPPLGPGPVATPPSSPPGAPSRLQVTRLEGAPYWEDRELSHTFGGMWKAVLQMSPEAHRVFRHAYVLRRRMAWTSYALVVAASGLALALVLFARKREKLLADRLASLTHSLKTPLAVLKLRCDTALNPDLAREVRETRLLEIQSEVDHLVRTIDSGLEDMRSRYSGKGPDRVDAAFFERLDEELTPAFESQDRMLEVYGSGVTLRCCATALRAALATLVENALAHGRGRVVVKAARNGDRVTLTVHDEGPGAAPEVLEAVRTATPPGTPGRQGAGMGLLVLAQVVRQEGWGLAFTTQDDGFMASIEIPA